MNDPAADSFAVRPWMDRLGRLTCDRPGFMRRLANFESRLLSDRLTQRIVAPSWIAGLARSGSTVLLELLAAHPDVATQRYRDFPPVLVPWLWNRFLDGTPLCAAAPRERAHRDRILVTPDSPEAFEEPLWMAFFEHLHDGARSQVLNAQTRNPAFETFLGNHIRKLLLVRDRPRYLAKANYNATRLEYLLACFPDARFVVPIREPLAHIASLVKQHALFCDGEDRHPAAVRHLARAGHFEFGHGRRPIHCGADAAVAEIAALRAAGREAEAWAVQWAAVYGLIAERLRASPALAQATLVVRYEDLCAHPQAELSRILAHSRLAPAAQVLREAHTRLQLPQYYRPSFSDAEREVIAARTAVVAGCFGYAGGAAAARTAIDGPAPDRVRSG